MWLAKAAAVTLGSGLVALVVLSGFWLALGLIAQARDITVPSSDVDRGGLARRTRAVALAWGPGSARFALTMIFRHTVATLALLFVYSVGGEIAVNLLPFEGAGRWSVGNNALGWLATHHRYFDSTHQLYAGRAVQLDAGDDPPRGGNLPRHPAADRGGGLAGVVQPSRRLRSGSGQPTCDR